MTSTEYAERFWWTPEWAEAELRAHFPTDVVDVVLAVCRDGESWDDAMVGVQRAIADVAAYKIKMQQHCRRILREQQTQAA